MESPPYSALQGSIEAASLLPRRLYSAESILPSPGERNSSSPSFIRRKDTSGRERAQWSAAAEQAEDSLRSDFRNLRRAGVLKKRSVTMTVVPWGQPKGDISSISPALRVRRVPSFVPAARDIISMRETEEMAASASPRKPMVLIASRPASSWSLLVAWRMKDMPRSSGVMPHPSSVTRM